MNCIYLFIINIKDHTFWNPVLCDVRRGADDNRVAFPRASWYVAVFTIAKKEIPACDWSGVQALALPLRSLHQRPGSPVSASLPGYRGGGPPFERSRRFSGVQENMFA